MIKIFTFLFAFIAFSFSTFSHQNHSLIPKYGLKGRSFNSFKENKNGYEKNHFDISLRLSSRTVKKTIDLRLKQPGINLDVVKPKYPLWIPIAEVIGMHGGVCLFSNFVLHNSFAKISFNSVKQNFKTGFVWDPDLFNTNFFAHPFNGSLYFNCARSNGYNYPVSALFAFGGSLTWELFMETEPPATNDIINTTVSGIFLGEITHRLSSLVIDERKTGFERVMREIGAGLIDLPRGFNRLFQGKSWRVVNDKYEREPLALNAYYGVNWNNYESKIRKNIANGVLGFGLIYGNLFKTEKRSPMDFFRLSGNFNFGAGQPSISSVEGYGLLLGKSDLSGKKSDNVFGLFQHYDYYENLAYQLGAISFGGGWIHRFKTSKNSLILSAIHLNLMPFGGSKSGYVNIVERTYSFSGGLNTKLEASLNYNWGYISATYNLYWFLVYVGPAGHEFYGVLRPKIAVNVTKNLEIGAQFLFGHKTGYYRDYPNVNGRTYQTMLILQYTIGDMRFLKNDD